MYFSKHNEKIKYINHASGLLEVKGEGVLYRKDTEVWPIENSGWTREYDTLSVTDGITELGEGYLDAFSHVGCLILSRTVKYVAASHELLKQMRKRKVLIRGEYDTFAEDFAKENKLNFLHSNIHIGEYDIEVAHEHDIVTLRFHMDAPPDIHFNCFTPGSSASHYGGGEYFNPLPRDFYVGCTIENFADILSERLREQILTNDALKRFLESANRRYGE